MKTCMLAAALAFCSLSVAGCSPGMVVRCASDGPDDPRAGAAAGRHADRRGGGGDGAGSRMPATRRTTPAVWVDESDPEASLIVATNKLRGLVVYGLDGAVVSTNDVGRVNNVDLRAAWTSAATRRSSSRPPTARPGR